MVIKPAGLLSVPGRGRDKTASALTYLRESHGEVLTVHRLDMDTSGLLIFARTAAAQAALSSQFEGRTVEKQYSALVEGCPDEPSGVITAKIGRNWLERPKRSIDEENGQSAETRWEFAGPAGGGAHLHLHPVTGRTHQLRLHMTAIGHPILGDPLYGNPRAASRLCLHASRMMLLHPGSQNTLELKSPAPFL